MKDFNIANRWLRIATAFVWLAATTGAALAFISAAERGWSPLIGVGLLIDGASLAGSALALVYMRQSRRMLESHKEAMLRMGDSVPGMFMDILRDLQEQGIIPPNVEISTILRPGSKPPGDKLN